MMRRAFIKLKNADRQTQIFILMFAIYMIALAWTTVQAYARLEYSRTGDPRPIMVPNDNS